MPATPTNPWLAVRPFGDRVAEALALRRLNEAFQSGRDVAGQLRGVVAQSWKRSGAAGIDPVDHVAPIVMDEREVADRWPRHPLYDVLPLIRDVLSGATSESAHMLVISDAQGVLMEIEGHSRVIEATEHMHLVPGADWSERGAGTNALGTAIALDHPVQIFSAEHFTRSVHPWQCSGAPIHDPRTGAIIGVIDLTGHLRSAHPHTLNLVTAAAGIAETHLRQELERDDARLRTAYVERIAGVTQPTLVRASGHVMAELHAGALRRARARDGADADRGPGDAGEGDRRRRPAREEPRLGKSRDRVLRNRHGDRCDGRAGDDRRANAGARPQRPLAAGAEADFRAA